VHLDLSQMSARLAEPVEIAFYRIAQEALTNAVKHAAATGVCIRFRTCGDNIEFVISDDGKGFDPNQTGSGLGLLGMRERATILGGQLFVNSRPDEGTEIKVVVPTVCTISGE
jgi:signal transduction histidine kinase